MAARLTLDPVPLLALRGGLALLLLFTAAHKLRDVAGFRAAVEGYGLLPGAWLTPAAALFVILELAFGASLIWPGSGAAPVWGAAALLILYTGAITINLTRGRRIDCGCAGPAGRVPLAWSLVARNAVLICAALVSAAPAGARTLMWLDGVTVCGGIAAMVLIYAAADTALANAARLRPPTSVDRSPHVEGTEELSWSTP